MHSPHPFAAAHAVPPNRTAGWPLLLQDAPAPVQLNLQVSVVPSLDKVGQAEWDACAAAGEVNPFLLWDFLHALESSKSAVREEGWLPQHVLARDEATGELLGCVPLYLKGHSYGERAWFTLRCMCSVRTCPTIAQQQAGLCSESVPPAQPSPALRGMRPTHPLLTRAPASPARRVRF